MTRIFWVKRACGVLAFAATLLAGLGSVQPADALSGFKSRYNSLCPQDGRTLCGVKHDLSSAQDGEAVRVEEGYSRYMEVICNRPQWEYKQDAAGDPVRGGWCGRWWTGAWSACSKSCGYGTQTRSVRCFQPDAGREGDSPAAQEDAPGTHASFIDDGQCAPGARPAASRSCIVRPCYGWSSWGPLSGCKLHNGTYYQERTRACWDRTHNKRVDPKFCRAHTGGREVDYQSCQTGWGSWDAWSSCGSNARKTRTRDCTLLSTGQKIADRYCAGSASQQRSCNTSWGSWSGWSACSSGGRKARERDCFAEGRRVADSHCSGSGRQTASCTPPKQGCSGSFTESMTLTQKRGAFECRVGKPNRGADHGERAYVGGSYTCVEFSQNVIPVRCSGEAIVQCVDGRWRLTGQQRCCTDTTTGPRRCSGDSSIPRFP